jgi:hypothetical protein
VIEIQLVYNVIEDKVYEEVDMLSIEKNIFIFHKKCIGRIQTNTLVEQAVRMNTIYC